MSLQVLLVDCFPTITTKGRREFKAWSSLVRRAIEELPTTEPACVTVCALDELERFCFDPDGASRDYLASVRRFDGMDFVIIDGDTRLLPWIPEARLLLHLVRMCLVTQKCMLACGPAWAMMGFLSRMCRESSARLLNSVLPELDPVPPGLRDYNERTRQLDHRKLLAWDTGDVFSYCSARKQSMWNLNSSGGDHESFMAANSDAGAETRSSRDIRDNHDSHDSRWKKVTNIGMRFVGGVRPQYRESSNRFLDGSLMKLEEWKCRIQNKFLHHRLFDSFRTRDFIIGRRKYSWVLSALGQTDAERGYVVLAESEECPQIIESLNSIGIAFRMDRGHGASFAILCNYLTYTYKRMHSSGRLCKWLSQNPMLLPVRALRPLTEEEKQQETRDQQRRTKSAFEFLMTNDDSAQEPKFQLNNAVDPTGEVGATVRFGSAGNDDEDSCRLVGADENDNADGSENYHLGKQDLHEQVGGRMQICVDDFADSALPPPVHFAPSRGGSGRFQRQGSARKRAVVLERADESNTRSTGQTRFPDSAFDRSATVRLPRAFGSKTQQLSECSKRDGAHAHRNVQGNIQYGVRRLSLKERQRRIIEKNRRQFKGQHTRSMPSLKAMDEFFNATTGGVQAVGGSNRISNHSLRRRPDRHGSAESRHPRVPAFLRAVAGRDVQLHLIARAKRDSMMRNITFTQYSKEEIFALPAPPKQMQIVPRQRAVPGRSPLWSLKALAVRDASRAKLAKISERDWRNKLKTFEPEVSCYMRKYSTQKFARNALSWSHKSLGVRRSHVKSRPRREIEQLEPARGAPSSRRFDASTTVRAFVEQQRVEQKNTWVDERRVRALHAQAERDDRSQYKSLKDDQNRADWQIASAVYYMNKRMEHRANDKEKREGDISRNLLSQNDESDQVTDSSDLSDDSESGANRHRIRDISPGSGGVNRTASGFSAETSELVSGSVAMLGRGGDRRSGVAVAASINAQIERFRHSRRVHHRKRKAMVQTKVSEMQFTKDAIRQMLHPTLLEVAASGSTAVNAEISAHADIAPEHKGLMATALAKETARAIESARLLAVRSTAVPENDATRPSNDDSIFMSAASGIDYSTTPAAIALAHLGRSGSRQHIRRASGPVSADIAHLAVPIVVRQKRRLSPFHERLARSQPRVFHLSHSQSSGGKGNGNDKSNNRSRTSKNGRGARSLAALEALSTNLVSSSPVFKVLHAQQSRRKLETHIHDMREKRRKQRREVLAQRKRHVWDNQIQDG